MKKWVLVPFCGAFLSSFCGLTQAVMREPLRAEPNKPTQERSQNTIDRELGSPYLTNLLRDTLKK